VESGSGLAATGVLYSAEVTRLSSSLYASRTLERVYVEKNSERKRFNVRNILDGKHESIGIQFLIESKSIARRTDSGTDPTQIPPKSSS
jgi:hypothetical protein